ncbi:MAG: ATP-grasp domain-containing protein [bacterium]|nr:ATP-grasp domain-containing protein [bacterium]
MIIGLTYDLRSTYLAQGFSEDEVAEFDFDETVEALEATIRGLGHTPVRIGTAKELCRRLVAGERWDLVYNLAEGVRGRAREAQVPCLLELYEIPYTCSDPLVCALTLDKALTKRVIRDAGLATPRFVVVTSEAEARACSLPYPLFAKPVAEGTGKGITNESRIVDHEQLVRVCKRLLAAYRQPVLVEEYLPGREFTVGIVGTGARARVIGTMEVEVLAEADQAIYSYENKEQCDTRCRYSTPPRDGLREAVEELALHAFRVLECRDVARVDIRLDGRGRPAFMEINPLPGMHPTHSDLPMIAARAGISFEELVGMIIASASERLRAR